MKKELQGSITVFLTLVFGVILSVITVTFENTRYLTAKSVIATAAEQAAMAVFGNYNRELYEEYGLFGYGGFDGEGCDALARKFQDILEVNLQTVPEGAKESYTNLYRFRDITTQIEDMEYLTQKKAFYHQIQEYLLSNSVSNFSDQLIGQYRKLGKGMDQQEMEKDLTATEEYERGEAVPPQKEEENNQTESRKGEDKAGGNPLKAFRKFIRDGVLSLVCEEESLSDVSIMSCYGDEEVEKKDPETNRKSESAAGILRGLLKATSGSVDDSLLDITKEKGELICYAQQVFGCYGGVDKHAADYELEYLISGKEEERDNLLGVINRLLLIRTAINFAYVNADSELKSKSMATATAIAGVAAVPLLVTALQKTILLIMAVEESCVDITALMEGKTIPLIKKKRNFKMKYEEICSAGKNLFRSKAASYPKENGKLTKGYFSYRQYLWVFMAMVSEKRLRCRTYDIIQFDLRSRFNQTFSLEQCIAGINYQVTYGMPLLWKMFLSEDQKESIYKQSVSGWYRYQ